MEHQFTVLEKRSSEIEEQTQRAMKALEESLSDSKVEWSTEEIASLIPNEQRDLEEGEMELMFDAMDELKTASQEDSSQSSIHTKSIRLLQAKLKKTSDQLLAAIDRAKKAESEAGSLSGKHRAAVEENTKLLKQYQNLQLVQISSDKNKVLLVEAQAFASELQTKLASTEKELENANKKLKKTETTLNATDIKLNRALEDLRKQKDSSSKISKSTTSISNLPSNHNLSTNEIVKIREDLKIAEKQKLNLTLLIKKQAQLIDVLKRQKLHLEAAKVLELTEKDFTKCLELSK